MLYTIYSVIVVNTLFDLIHICILLLYFGRVCVYLPNKNMH